MSQGRPDISVVIGSMRIGGAERATMHLINGLSKKGLKVDLVLLFKAGDFLDSIDPNINIVNLNKRKASQGIGAFRKYLKQNNPKIVSCSKSYSINGFDCCKINKLERKDNPE